MMISSKQIPQRENALQTFGRLFVTFVAGLLLLCQPFPGWTETIAGELSLSHAAFLVSAARFTTWPADAFQDERSPLVFCVYKDPETSMALQERLHGETIRGRSLRQVDIDTLGQLSQCHVLYLPAARIGDYPATVEGVYGVLTVSDCREFAEADGVLGFIRSEQGVDVIINPEALSQSGLSISPGLLQMAERVKSKNTGSENRPIGR